MPRQGNKGKSSSGSKSVKLGPGFPPQLLNRLLRSQRRCIPFRNTFLTMYNTSQCSRGIPNKSDSEQKYDNFYYSSPKAATDMGVSSSESHDLTAFYEMESASFGVLSQITGFYPSLDRIVETMLGPLNLGPGGGSYNELISHLHRLFLEHVWCHHRLLEEVISDRRPTFMSNFSCELATLLGVKLTPSTSYHPHARGGCRLGAGERSAGEPESRLGWRDSQETTMGLSLGPLSRMGSVGWLPGWEE